MIDEASREQPELLLEGRNGPPPREQPAGLFSSNRGSWLPLASARQRAFELLLRPGESLSSEVIEVQPVRPKRGLFAPIGQGLVWLAMMTRALVFWPPPSPPPPNLDPPGQQVNRPVGLSLDATNWREVFNRQLANKLEGMRDCLRSLGDAARKLGPGEVYLDDVWGAVGFEGYVVANHAGNRILVRTPEPFLFATRTGAQVLGDFWRTAEGSNPATAKFFERAAAELEPQNFQLVRAYPYLFQRLGVEGEPGQWFDSVKLSAGLKAMAEVYGRLKTSQGLPEELILAAAREAISALEEVLDSDLEARRRRDELRRLFEFHESITTGGDGNRGDRHKQAVLLEIMRLLTEHWDHFPCRA